MTSTQFGLCSWTLGHEDPAEIMQLTRAMGLDGLQFHGDHTSHDPAAVRAAADAAGLIIFAIDPIGCAPRSDDIADAKHGVDYYTRVIDFAAAMGCDTVTVHGLAFWCQDQDDRSGALQRLVASLQQLCDHAATAGIRLLWEMCNRYEAPMVRASHEGRSLHAQVERDNFALILDSFHMNIEDRDPVAEIEATGKAIAIYHVSDSNRSGIGSGHVDFRSQHRALRAAGFNSPVMLEFVLPGLGPHTPPETEAQWQALHAEFKRSLQAWRGYDAQVDAESSFSS